MPKTRWDIAVEVAALIGGKPWQGGDNVRVYLGKGYAEVGSTYLNCRALKDHNAYTAICDAGLEAYKTVTANSTATVVRRAAGRTTCLNCDSTGLLIGNYCTDCHGEC